VTRFLTAELRIEEKSVVSRWQHLSHLKASTFFTLVVTKLNNLYFVLGTPSIGRYSPNVTQNSLLRLANQNVNLAGLVGSWYLRIVSLLSKAFR
jgi:hypothetical protein